MLFKNYNVKILPQDSWGENMILNHKKIIFLIIAIVDDNIDTEIAFN